MVAAMIAWVSEDGGANNNEVAALSKAIVSVMVAGVLTSVVAVSSYISSGGNCRSSNG